MNALKVTLLTLTHFFLTIPNSEAKRKIVAPPYMRRIIFEFNSANPPSLPEGQMIGNQMTVNINLSNLSAVSQSGTIALGGSAQAVEVGRTTSANTHLSLCAETTNGNDSGMPSPVTFTIGPNQTVSYSASAFFHSVFHAVGPSGHAAFDASFTPSIEITINEDRGAVQGVITPVWDGPVPGATACDGFSFTGYVGAFKASESRTGVPLLINGGRPF